ncbi:MAG: sigma 54-interacting transcriptional regulator [Deltaproteobacteria bacterium]|nr:sigma 54-interacting transcriptional regulator [Deltaproteobacteria bacterium]
MLEEIISYAHNLERVLDNLKEGIIAHDTCRRIFFFNQEAEKITGFSKEEVLGKDCHQAFGKPFCGSRCHFCSDLPVLGDKDECITHIQTRQGEFRRIEMRVTAMADNQGTLLGVLAAFRDVTGLLNLQLKAEKFQGFADIIGQDVKMLEIFHQIRNIAGYDYPVHISGETGTGKELVAAALHSESPRSQGPFVPINCGALPEGLIESELFGHVKGAFTGAIRDKKGRFELADGGTVFLDEVAELTKPVQVKLLRFLQEGEFERVGGEKTISVNVKVISATNKDLKKEVRSNRFRDDLYYRLNVIPIHLPPLRERKSDIPLLIEHFLKEAARRNGQKPRRISIEALSLMTGYRWPGNIRELQNAIQYAVVKCQGNIILPKDIPLEIHCGTRPDKMQPDRMQMDKARHVSGKLTDFLVKSALERSGDNKVKAAKLLGVGRATLYRYLKNSGNSGTAEES